MGGGISKGPWSQGTVLAYQPPVNKNEPRGACNHTPESHRPGLSQRSQRAETPHHGTRIPARFEHGPKEPLERHVRLMTLQWEGHA